MRQWISLGRVRCYSLFAAVAVAAFSFGSCRRSEKPGKSAGDPPDQEDSAAGEQDAGSHLQRGGQWKNERPAEVLAAWYDVPEESLAESRADGEAFTAAHNHLPIGTLVDVTNPANGKSVRVRISDRGIHDRRVELDLSKQAAEQLGMLSKGLARVRMQVVSEPTGTSGSASPAASSP